MQKIRTRLLNAGEKGKTFNKVVKINTYLFICLMLFLVPRIPGYAQSNYTAVYGVITDSTSGQPVSEVHVSVKGTKTGAVSNAKGYYELKIKDIPAKLVFSHVSYEPREITVFSRASRRIDVSMILDINLLKPVEVTDIKDLIEKKPLFIYDYCFYKENLLLIAFKYQRLKNAYMVLMRPNGDTICSLPIDKPDRLYNGCLGYSHFFTGDLVYQVYYDSVNLRLIYPVNKKQFLESYTACVTKIKHKLFLQQYSYSDQVLEYIYYNLTDSTYNTLKVIIDEKGLRMLIDSLRFAGMNTVSSGNSEADARFEKMCFFDPVFAPLFNLNGTPCIINYVDSRIELYNNKDSLIKETPIRFHKDPHWKEKVFADEKTGKVYTLFQKNGISYLYQINLNTGGLSNPIVIPRFQYIEKISVRNNFVYFLYKEKAYMAYKKLYRMKVE